MLSLRHSIGNVSPLESLARNSQSVPHFRCYASPPRTETYARDVLRNLSEKTLFLGRFLMPSIRVFYVYPKSSSGSPPSTLKTYQMAGGTSYVFLPQKPEENPRLMSVAATKDLLDVGRSLI